MTTDDIGLAAALAAHQLLPANITHKNGRTIWEFEDSLRMVALRAAYFAGWLHGSLLAYNLTLPRWTPKTGH